MFKKTYDFALCWSGTIKEFFVKALQEHCRNQRLSFLWINQENVSSTLKQLQKHSISIRVLLDTEATYNDPKDIYAKICYAAKDDGTVIINDPDRTKSATDKAFMHHELKRLGIDAPYSVIVRNWEPSNFRLTDIEKQNLGIPFVIKPSLGYGQLGVIRDAKGSIAEIARARNFSRGDDFLLQEKILPLQLAGKRAWFRVYHLFDRIIPCWWDDHQNLYEHVSFEEFNSYRLFALAKIVTKISNTTKMYWFSTEVAIDEKYNTRRYLAIDYVNDQCDMSSKSESINGVPDVVVDYTAQRIAEAARQSINRQKNTRKYSIILKDATIVDIRGLGAPLFLKG